MNYKKIWLSNSLFNLCGGLSAVLLSFFLMGVLSRYLPKSDFAFWNISTQIGFYINLLALGLQNAVARMVANANDISGGGKKILIVKAARSIANWSLLLSILFSFFVVIFYPLTFSDVPDEAIIKFRFVLVCFSISATFQILSQVDMGFFQGVHKNRFFVLALIFTRIVAVLIVSFLIYFDQSLIVIALLLNLSLALIYPCMRFLLRKYMFSKKTEDSLLLDKKLRFEILLYGGSLSVWTLCMLAINSSGVLMVGYYDFDSVSAYSIAMTISLGISALLGSALSPLMTTAAHLCADKNSYHLIKELLKKSTLYLNIVVNFLFLFLLFSSFFILKLWVGEELAESSQYFVFILVAAYCIRSLGSPYALVLLATGLHKRALLSAILESILTIICSLILCFKYGAVGVALGSLFGAVFGLVLNFSINFRKTPEIIGKSTNFVLLSIVMPITIFSPFYIYYFGFFK